MCVCRLSFSGCWLRLCFQCFGRDVLFTSVIPQSRPDFSTHSNISITYLYSINQSIFLHIPYQIITPPHHMHSPYPSSDKRNEILYTTINRILTKSLLTLCHPYATNPKSHPKTVTICWSEPQTHTHRTIRAPCVYVVLLHYIACVGRVANLSRGVLALSGCPLS